MAFNRAIEQYRCLLRASGNGPSVRTRGSVDRCLTKFDSIGKRVDTGGGLSLAKRCDVPSTRSRKHLLRVNDYGEAPLFLFLQDRNYLFRIRLFFLPRLGDARLQLGIGRAVQGNGRDMELDVAIICDVGIA